MASRYDNTRYLPALIHEVKTFGIETSVEDVTRMAEIIANTPQTTLIHYASGEGVFGEPPSQETKRNQVAFFTILFHVWGWNQTSEFYLKHGAPEKVRNAKLREEVADLKAKAETLRKALDNSARENLKLIRESEALEAELAEAKTEIQHLKAYMYDLLTTIENMKTTKGETSNEE